MLTPYADYNFYTEVYKGTKLTEEQWERVAVQASIRIKNRALGAIGSDMPEEMRYCCCELAEFLQAAEESCEGLAGITAEKDGSWSASYESTEARESSTERRVRATIERWLAATGLLYSGVTVL